MIDLLVTTASAVELEFTPIASTALLFANLLLLVALLLHVSGRWRIPSVDRRTTTVADPEARSSPPPSPSTGANQIFPGIDPADHATVPEQETFLHRLAALPQMWRMTDGSLIDWSTGQVLVSRTSGKAGIPPFLVLQRFPSRGLGMIRREGLAHYLAYQEGLAAVLAAGVPSPAAVTGQGEF